MRNWKFIIRGLALASAITTVAACEDSQPARRPTTQLTEVGVPSSGTPVVAQPSKPTPPPVTPPVDSKPMAVEDNSDSDDGTPMELVKSARDAIDAGEIDRAMKLARLAVKKSPNRSSAWNTLGRAQLKKGERKSAIVSFQKAVGLNPSSSYAQNNLGLALIYDGKFEDAIAALEEATQLEPVESYMFNNLGMAYEHQDRLEEARDAYRQAFELDGEHARENLARLEGVKTIRTAKADLPKPSDAIIPVDQVPTDDGGVN